MARRRPWIGVEPVADRPLARRVDDQHRAHAVADRAAEEDEAVVDERLHELRVLGPAVLLAQRARAVPRGTPLSDYDEVHASARMPGIPSARRARQLSPRSGLSQIWPSARPAKRRPSAATSAYGIAGSGSGSPSARARHGSPPRPPERRARGSRAP